MIRIRGVDHVVFRVSDLDRCLAFYRDVLGCAVAKENPIGIVHLRAGDALIDLVPLDSDLGRQSGGAPDHDAPNVDHVCFHVAEADPEKILAHLRAHGVEAGEPTQRYGATGDGLSIYFSDPEGNQLEIRGFSPCA